MQPLLFYKISISYHIFRGKKRGFEKNCSFSSCLVGLYKSTFQNFLPGTRHSPPFPHPHNFYLAHGTRASSEKNPEDFCSPFSKNASEKFDFRPNRNISGGNFRKGVQKQTGFDFFCAVCQVFFVRFTFSAPPPERLQKNKSVLSA